LPSLACPPVPSTDRSASPPRSDDALLRAYARTRDAALRERLVTRYLPLARYAAAQFRRGTELFDDLVQVASVGLLNAIDRFDPDNGASFSSYALPTINGELRRYFRDRSWAVRPPRDLQEQSLKVERVTQQLRAELGHGPTVQDIAQRCDLPIEVVLEAREALQARNAASLSSTPHDDEEHPGLDGCFGVIDEGFARAEQRAVIDHLSAALTKRERTIIRMRFEHDLTQAEIGALVGLSQMHVSRMLRASVEKLRVHATEVQINEP
jgi:RNA polymerase sigma-B factor